MIYIVTAGSYSDYGILAAFTDEAAAKRFVDVYNSADPYDHADIEEYVDGSEVTEYLFNVTTRRNDPNETGDEFKVSFDGMALAGVNRRLGVVDRSDYQPWEQSGPKATIYSVTVRATNKADALKAGVEMIHRFRAETNAP